MFAAALPGANSLPMLRAELAACAGFAAVVAYILYRRRHPTQMPRTLTQADACAYCCHVRLSVKPERRADFLKAIAAVRAASLRGAAPRALSYIYGEDVSAPNVFHVHQAFESKADFDAQMSLPHGSDFHAFLRSGPLAEKPVVAFMQTMPQSSLAPVLSGQGASRGVLRCLNVRMTVRPERRDEFLRSILADQAGTLANEPLARAFVVGEDIHDHNTFYLHEQYVGAAGFEAHKAAPHFAPWQAFVDTEPFVGPLHVDFFDSIPSP